MHVGDLQQRRHEPHHHRRHVAGRLGHHEEDGQQIDEPERAERLDEGQQILRGTTFQPASAAKPGALKANWMVTHSA